MRRFGLTSRLICTQSCRGKWPPFPLHRGQDSARPSFPPTRHNPACLYRGKGKHVWSHHSATILPREAPRQQSVVVR